MIQSRLKSNFDAWINTKSNQITPNADIDFPHGNLRFLVKFTNDMSGEELYVYPDSEVHNRYTKFQFKFVSTNPNMFAAEIILGLAGYWKYEIYEVFFFEVPPTGYGLDNSPKTENDILAPSPEHGIVKGLVAIGKMYVKEAGGLEEVQYNEYVEPTETNYIYSGQ